MALEPRPVFVKESPEILCYIRAVIFRLRSFPVKENHFRDWINQRGHLGVEIAFWHKKMSSQEEQSPPFFWNVDVFCVRKWMPDVGSVSVFGRISAAMFRFSHFRKSLTTFLHSNSKRSAVSRWGFPSDIIALVSDSRICVWAVTFHRKTPLMQEGEILHQGCFCLPVVLARFTSCSG